MMSGSQRDKNPNYHLFLVVNVYQKGKRRIDRFSSCYDVYGCLSTLPGSAPVCSESSMTGTPLTMT